MDYAKLMFFAEVRKLAMEIYRTRMMPLEISESPLIETTYKQCVQEAFARIMATGRILTDFMDETETIAAGTAKPSGSAR